MANFEAFLQSIKLSANILFLKSVELPSSFFFFADVKALPDSSVLSVTATTGQLISCDAEHNTVLVCVLCYLWLRQKKLTYYDLLNRQKNNLDQKAPLKALFLRYLNLPISKWVPNHPQEKELIVSTFKWFIKTNTGQNKFH